jgi:probable addiction module antidote protein
MTEQFTRFEAAEFLKSPEEVDTYLNACFEEDTGDGVLIRVALNDIARAQGMVHLACDTAKGCEILKKT